MEKFDVRRDAFEVIDNKFDWERRGDGCNSV
jgi:hypothetical protein